MISLLNLLLRLARCTSGTAALEGALVLPVAISLMAGGIEFGRIFVNYATADESMRSAARYLARVPQGAICGWGLTNAKNLAVYGKLNPSANDVSLIPGWTTGTVTLSSPADCGALADPVIIDLRAAVAFNSLMLSAVGLSNSFTLNVGHQERHIGE